MLNVSRIRDVEEGPDGLTVTVEYLPTGEQVTIEADVLVHATGYRPHDVAALLGEAGKLCLRDDEDALKVSRDHRVQFASTVTAGVYLQGGTEHSHGLTSTLLSTTAIRAGEIRDSVLAHRATVATY